jgi:syntaxin 1B/2/3
MSSNRYGESRAAYREVQERHEDIKRIEKTLGELAQLFNDVCFHSIHRNNGSLTLPIKMSVLVEQQDETINTIEAQADTVQKDTEAGSVSPNLFPPH